MALKDTFGNQRADNLVLITSSIFICSMWVRMEYCRIVSSSLSADKTILLLAGAV